MSFSRASVEEQDNRSELGALYEQADNSRVEQSIHNSPLPSEGIVRADKSARVVGRGPIQADPRKFHYDTNRGRIGASLAFGATRADRLDAREAGDLLHAIHVMYGIDREDENVIAAFDKAVFFEHTVNGASMMQPGEGFLYVGDSAFQLQLLKTKLGRNQRRFFRAFADEIAAANRDTLAAYDAYDPASVEKHGQIMQVAIERGLQKYPYLAHDSSDAGLRVTLEERHALIGSKRLVLQANVDSVNVMPERA